MKVYVASPLGFTEAGRVFYRERLLPALEDAGIEPLDPWTWEADYLHVSKLEVAAQRSALETLNRRVGQRNEDLIRESAAVLAVLDGEDVDSGTAAEVGFASALGRPVVGWRSDLRSGGDNPAAVVNIQVEHFIVQSGGTIERELRDAIDLLCEIRDSAAP